MSTRWQPKYINDFTPTQYCAVQGELSILNEIASTFSPCMQLSERRKRKMGVLGVIHLSNLHMKNIIILPHVWQKSRKIACVSFVATTGYLNLRLQFHPTIEESTKVQGGRISFSLGHLASQKIPFWGREHWNELYCECWSDVKNDQNNKRLTDSIRRP